VFSNVRLTSGGFWVGVETTIIRERGHNLPPAYAMTGSVSRTRELLTNCALPVGTHCFPESHAVYTVVMSRRFIALLVVLVMGLQGPILAFAAAATTTVTAHCCPGHDSGIAGNGCSPCPAGVLAGTCCAGSPVFTARLDSQIPIFMPASTLLLSQSDSIAFVTESPTPNFRPPIV